jgi:hypothetical protein
VVAVSDDPTPEAADGPTPPESSDENSAMATDTTDSPATSDPTDDEPADDRGDLVRYAHYALLGGLTLLALVATLRLYLAASTAIDIWVAREYRPLFQAAFNLVVLLLAAVGISWEVRQVAG